MDEGTSRLPGRYHSGGSRRPETLVRHRAHRGRVGHAATPHRDLHREGFDHSRAPQHRSFTSRDDRASRRHRGDSRRSDGFATEMTRRAAVGGTRRAWLAAFASVAVASAATAQSACPPSATAASRAWAAPLDRKIALQARDVSLRDGLDRVAAAAKFRLSYSAELVPLSRHVCEATESVIAGEALLQLLAGSGVEAVVTGPDQVVLTPNHPQLPDEVETATVQNLDRVVVTGSATGNAQRSLSVALDVLDGDKLRAQSTTTLSQTFDGSVPGLWVWEQSPSSKVC